MALKSKEWFFKHCYAERQAVTRLAHLSHDILEKGMGQKDATRGHVTQAVGAVQLFLAKFPKHREAIKAAEPTEPYDIKQNPQMLSDWLDWFSSQGQSTYGRADFGYNLDVLRGLLTPALGGTRKGGGGGNDEFKRVLRLMPEFWGRD